ncbi:MAG: hypothetical protein ACYC23_19165, partial [Limisphaerales bacterium]
RNAPVHHGEQVFQKVSECLCRLKTTGAYYALVKRSGKQFRRSLRTQDAQWARRRLAELRKNAEEDRRVD